MLDGSAANPVGKIGTLCEVFAKELDSGPWWVCQLCNHQVFTKRLPVPSAKDIFKRSMGPPLPRHGIQDEAISKAYQAKRNQEIGWKADWEPTHGQEVTGLLSKLSVRSQSRSLSKGVCGLVTCRGDVPKKSPCPQNPFVGTFPPRQERVNMWRNFKKKRNRPLLLPAKLDTRATWAPKKVQRTATASGGKSANSWWGHRYSQEPQRWANWWGQPPSASWLSP